MTDLDPTTFRPETQALHAGQQARPDDERTRRTDLRDHELRLRRRSPRRAALRAPGVREHLHPDHEPDDGRLRAADRGARRRRRRPRPRRPVRLPRRSRSSTSRGPATTSSARPRCTAARTTCSTHTLPKIGITTRFVDGGDPSAFGRAIDEKTKAVFLELIGNPRLDVHDLASIADVAHARGVPVIVDNTFAPLLAQPIKHGADIVIHSATKWIGGHGTAIGGVVVDGGTFDWAASSASSRTSSTLIRPTTGSATRRPSVRLAFILKLRVQGLRDIGAALSPFNAFLFLQGLETLPLRIQRHSENALAVAQWLESRDRRRRGSATRASPSHPSYKQATKYLTGGFGGIVTFGVKGGVEAGRELIDNVQIFSLLANVGDAKSLIIHPGLHDALAARAGGAGARPASRPTSSACRSVSSTSMT